VKLKSRSHTRQIAEWGCGNDRGSEERLFSSRREEDKNGQRYRNGEGRESTPSRGRCGTLEQTHDGRRPPRVEYDEEDKNPRHYAEWDKKMDWAEKLLLTLTNKQPNHMLRERVS
jgi:hypothetical protein